VRWRIQFVVRTSLQDFRNQDGKRSLDGRVSFPDFNQSISFAVSFATEGQREELRRRRDSLKFKRDYSCTCAEIIGSARYNFVFVHLSILRSTDSVELRGSVLCAILSNPNGSSQDLSTIHLQLPMWIDSSHLLHSCVHVLDLLPNTFTIPQVDHGLLFQFY
jgi:hypothetical protein